MTGSSSTRDFTKGLGSTLAARIGAVIEIIAQPIYVFLFGLAAYGMYAVLWATVSLVENIADLGMTSALQRVVPRAADERAAATALRLAMIIGVTPNIAIALFVTLFAPQLTHIFNVAATDQDELVHAMQLFSWALPLWAFIEISTAALRARKAFGPEIRLRIFWEQVLRLAVAGAIYLVWPSIMSLFVAHLISLAIVAMLSFRLLGRYYATRHLFAAAPKGQMAELLSVGLSTHPANVIGKLFSEGPPIALNALIPGVAGATAAALYTIARKLASVVLLARNAFAYVLSPIAAYAHGDRAELVRLYRYASRLMCALVMSLGACMMAGAPALLRFFGPQGMLAETPMLILIAARMLESVLGLSVPVLLALGDLRQRLAGSIVGMVVAVVAGLLLMPRFHTAGGAAAIGLAIVATAAMQSWALYRRQKLHIFDRNFARVLTRSVAISFVAAMLLLPTRELHHLAALPILALILTTSLWLSARYALPLEDRLALGGSARKLGLLPRAP